MGPINKPHLHLFVVMADLIIDLLPQAFSRRFPWHPQGACLVPRDFGTLPWVVDCFFVDFVEECMEMSLSNV